MPSADSSQQPSEGDSIKVFVRVRPPDAFEKEGNPCLHVDNGHNAVIMQSKPEPKIFSYDHVADTNATQESVFSLTGKAIIESCVNGYNGTVFAYGQTGSGKTFTMLGPPEHSDTFQHELRGVIPRAFEYLFKLIDRQQEVNGDKKQFLCRCSFLEIYNEQIFDLLDTASAGLHLRENIKHGVFVDGLIEQAVNSSHDAYQVLQAGWNNRTVASTSMNRESSRSHAVFTLVIESKENKNGVWKVRTSQLNLVDLAGSERQKDALTVGIRLKEAGSINKSLSVLGNVITALVDIAHGKNRHVPYRDSKLSFLLRDSLGGNAKTYMIACVHPGTKCFGETLSTLQFARRAKMIKNKAVINEDMHGNIADLQAELRRVKDLLHQYQQGTIPTQPSLPGAVVNTTVAVDTTEGTGSGKSEHHWRSCFTDAMYFRELTEANRQLLENKVKTLIGNSSRNNQLIRQKCMVIKFRDEAIKKLEKALKQGPCPELMEGVYGDLRNEVKVMNDIVEHHPDVILYKSEVSHLKAEIQRLQKEAEGSQNLQQDAQRIAELEKIFQQLQAESGKNAEKKNDYETPQQNADTKPVSTATVERQKSQISRLQTENERLRQEFAEEKQAAQKTQIGLESQITSLEKCKQEYEQILKTKQEWSEAISAIHMDTIKTMSTPTRTRYQLRNRAILRQSLGTTPTSPLDVSVDEEELITAEAAPQQMVEEHAEALNEEIKRLQDMNHDLMAQLESRDTEVVNIVQDRSRLETENAKLNALLTDERQDWMKTHKDLTDHINKLTQELTELGSERNMYSGEVEDLRLMLKATDKDMQAIKNRHSEQLDSHRSELASLETKVMRLDSEMGQLVKEREEHLETIQQLRESVENMEATLSFEKDNLDQAEEKISDLNEQVNTLQGELMTTVNKLHMEQEKTKQLEAQLTHQEGEKEQELLRIIHERDQLCEELQVSQTKEQAQDGKIRLLDKELQKSRETIELLTKENCERKEAISNYITKVQTIKQELVESHSQRDSQAQELTDMQRKLEDMAEANEDLRTQCQEKARQLEDLSVEMEREKCRLSFEKDVLQDDFSELSDKYTSLTEDREALQQEKGSLEVHLGQKEVRINELNQKVTELEKAMTDQKVQIKTLEAEKLQVLCQEQKEKELEDTLAQMQDKVDVLRDSNTKLQNVNQNLEKFLQEKQTEVTQLKEQNGNFELEIEIQKTNFHKLSLEIESERLDLNCRMDKLREENMQLQEEKHHLQEETKELPALSKECNSLREQLQMSSAREGRLLLELEEKQGCVTRLQLVCDQDQVKMTMLLSDVEQQKETISKLTKTNEVLEVDNQRLREENVDLIGHQNHKQKIHHTHALKEENIKLQEQIKKFQRDIYQLKSRCLCGKANTPAKARKEGMKENIYPSEDAHTVVV